MHRSLGPQFFRIFSKAWPHLPFMSTALGLELALVFAFWIWASGIFR